MRTTTTRYFLISFYLSSSLRVTCIILRLFLMVLAVACTIPIFLSLSLFSFSPSVSLLFCLCLSHNSLPCARHYITALTFVTRIYRRSLMCIYVRPLEDCFFPKLHIHICMCKPCVLWMRWQTFESINIFLIDRRPFFEY